MSEEKIDGGRALVWSTSVLLGIGIAALLLGALFYAFRDGLLLMVNWWERMPEYNHGYIIPFVAAYMLLVCAEDFRTVQQVRAWSGLLVVGDKISKNANNLMKICREITRANLIQGKVDINRASFSKFKRVGIIATASTPSFVVDEVIKCLKLKK